MRSLVCRVAVAVAAIIVAPGPVVAKDEIDADCAKFAMALQYTPLFVGNGLLCHTSFDHFGPVEIIEARGRHNFTFLRHVAGDDGTSLLPDDLEYVTDRTDFFRATEQWGETVRRGEFETRAFGGVPQDSRPKGFECVAFSRYSGEGAEPGTFRHELFGLFCFEASKGPVPMSGDLIEDFLTRIRLEF